MHSAGRTAAQADPVGFVAGLPAKSILDEVQRVPQIFTSLKAVIDAHRAAGRFILTGSANVLLVPHLADSLAGRMGILRLHPLAQCEIGRARSRFLDDLLRGRFHTGLPTRLAGNSPAASWTAAMREAPQSIDPFSSHGHLRGGGHLIPVLQACSHATAIFHTPFIRRTR